jgi:hypothetical protein
LNSFVEHGQVPNFVKDIHVPHCRLDIAHARVAVRKFLAAMNLSSTQKTDLTENTATKYRQIQNDWPICLKKKTKKMRILNSKVILTPNKPESWPVPDCCGRHIPRLDLLSDKAVLNTHQAATNKPCCYDML